MKYNWQHIDWPNFRYSTEAVDDMLFEFTSQLGRAGGLLKALPDTNETEAVIALMVAEAVKTSEIEGEYLSREDVMSSIRNNLGLGRTKKVTDRRAEGVAELMLSVRQTYAEPLSTQLLFSWHSMLMKADETIKKGGWRTHPEPMQVISGAMGKEKIHYEAPPSELVENEMNEFIQWFNNTGPGGVDEIKKPIVRSAIAHLWFESIHPFEDGNGRIGRAIAEKALSQKSGRPVVLSLSKVIEADKKGYYNALQTAQRTLEVTPWVNYFVKVVIEAQKQAEELIDFTLKKTRFFEYFGQKLNDRQLKVVNRMLDEGPEGFEGGMSATKYISITKTSKATATRDLQDLAEKKVLLPFGGGRSTRYQLNLKEKYT